MSGIWHHEALLGEASSGMREAFNLQFNIAVERPPKTGYQAGIVFYNLVHERP